MAITTFDRTNLKTIRHDVDQALAEVAKKHGIHLSIGTIRFDGANFRTKLTGDVITPGGNSKPTEDPQEAKWRKGLTSFAAHVAGITPKDAGRLFNLYGEQYELIGFRSKARLQVVARKSGRKSYTALPLQAVAAALKSA